MSVCDCDCDDIATENLEKFLSKYTKLWLPPDDPKRGPVPVRWYRSEASRQIITPQSTFKSIESKGFHALSSGGHRQSHTHTPPPFSVSFSFSFSFSAPQWRVSLKGHTDMRGLGHELLFKRSCVHLFGQLKTKKIR